MSPTLTLLAAGLLATQTAEPPTTGPAKTCSCQKNAQTTGYVAPVAATPAPSSGLGFGLFRSKTETAVAVEEPRPSFLSKIQGYFKKSDASEPAVYQVEPPVESKTPFRLMNRLPAGEPTSSPAPTAVPPAPVKPITYQAVPVNSPTQPLSIPVTPVSGTTAAGSNVIKTADLPPSRPNRISPELVNKVGHEQDYSWITGQLRSENGQLVIHYASPETVDRFNGSLILQSDAGLTGFNDGDYVSVRGSVTTSAGRNVYRLNAIDRLPR